MPVLDIDPEKFWTRVQRGGPDECWPWMGARRGGSEYGQVVCHHTWIGAHRAAYMLTHGVRLDRHQQVCHHCDNPPCCNPAHLFVGTAADNAADKVRKGRQPRGERVVVSKLTEAQVSEIRARLGAGESQSALGRAFGVHQVTIYRIGRGQVWRHMGEGPAERPSLVALAKSILAAVENGDLDSARGSMSRLWRNMRPEKKDGGVSILA